MGIARVVVLPHRAARIAVALLAAAIASASDAAAATVLADAAVVAGGATAAAPAAVLAWEDRRALADALAGRRASAPASRSLAADPALAAHARATWHDGRLYRRVLGALIDADGRAWRPVAATVTAYTPRREECDDDPDTTATGTDALRTRGIAADPRALPYRTLLRVPGYGEARVDDTGGAMRRDFAHGEIHLDVRIPRRGDDGRWRSEADCVRLARAIGVRHETVLVRMR